MRTAAIIRFGFNCNSAKTCKHRLTSIRSENKAALQDIIMVQTGKLEIKFCYLPPGAVHSFLLEHYSIIVLFTLISPSHITTTSLSYGVHQKLRNFSV